MGDVHAFDDLAAVAVMFAVLVAAVFVTLEVLPGFMARIGRANKAASSKGFEMGNTSREWDNSIDEQQRRLRSAGVWNPPPTSEAPDPPPAPPTQQDQERQVAELTAKMRAFRETRAKSDKQKIEELRAIIDKQAQENAALLEAAVEFRKERDHWKANHDNQVRLKQTIAERPDLQERAKRVAELQAQVDQQASLIVAKEARTAEVYGAIRKLFDLLFPPASSCSAAYVEHSPSDMTFDWLRAYGAVEALQKAAISGMAAGRTSEVDEVDGRLFGLRLAHAKLQEECEILRRFKSEFEATPKWVPVGEFEDDSKFHVVWDSSKNDAFDAKIQKRAGGWVPAYDTERLPEVTHVLVGLHPPVVGPVVDPRGDGDIEDVVPDTDVKMTTEQMADAFDEITEKTKQTDDIAASSNDPAGDASDIERAIANNCMICRGTGRVDLSREPCCTEQIECQSCNGTGLKADVIRERLLQPFFGNEADKFGAKTYRLRGGEVWQYLSLLDKWETAKSSIGWYRNVRYRLAEGQCHAKID